MAEKRKKQKNYRNEEPAKKLLLCCICGILIGMLTALLLLTVCAKVISGCNLSVTVCPGVAAVCGICAAAIGGFFAGLLAGKKGLPVGLGQGLFWVLLLFLVNSVMREDGIQTVTCIKAGLCLLVSAVGGMLGAFMIQKREKRRYIY